MAKGKGRRSTGAGRRAARPKAGRKRSPVRASGKRPKAKARRRSAGARKAGARTGSRKATARGSAKPRRVARTAKDIVPAKVPRLDRVRRTLDDTVPTPPSSLNMERHGSAARTGRAELADNLRKHGGITPGITGGDVDANFGNAYFSGDEAPGGDNPTPDQDVVDDIGKALGVQYNDDEELKAADKLNERDKHRWELDPASSEDYKERD